VQLREREREEGKADKKEDRGKEGKKRKERRNKRKVGRGKGRKMKEWSLTIKKRCEKSERKWDYNYMEQMKRIEGWREKERREGKVIQEVMREETREEWEVGV
jgi:hypothetical protein